MIISFFRQIKKIIQVGFIQKIRFWVRRNPGKSVIAVLAFLCLIIGAILFSVNMNRQKAREVMSQEVNKVVEEAKDEMLPSALKVTPPPEDTDTIYSYLQGPKSWRKKIPWSGEWGVSFYDGGSFGGFGCGLCCIANIYSSLTKYQCTPVDAYHYAKKHTGYMGGGAIDWGYMRQSLNEMGFNCHVEKKPETYREFQEDIKNSQAAVVLVSSNNSKCYWKDTPGHYVTIFLYNEKKDQVFLADSGDPDHNRQWISLKKIYKSLKTSSSWQYLMVQEYNQKEDQWRHKEAKGNWIKE